MTNMIDAGLVADQNAKLQANLQADYDALGGMLSRRGLDIEELTSLAQTFEVAAVVALGMGGVELALALVVVARVAVGKAVGHHEVDDLVAPIG